MTNKKLKKNQTTNRDQKIIKVDTNLELQNQHKDWYAANQMGKQGNKPRMVKREKKKGNKS